MRTLYIDIYFLINFTVDILSLYFAAILSKTATSAKRLIISSLIGAFTAVFTVLLPEYPLLKLFFGALGLVLMSFTAPKKVLFHRRIKFTFAFLIFEALVGGAVSFIWGIMDKYISKLLSGTEGGAVNRKMLFLALIILLSIGVFKMIVSFFSNAESEGNIDVEVSFLETTALFSAFIDSGNLAIDPMDMTPVLFIKPDLARTILPESIIELSNIDSLDRSIKKRIRLIPITRNGQTHVVAGVKADSVKVIQGDRVEEISVTLAVDKEGGNYGGYQALMPSAALGNVKR